MHCQYGDKDNDVCAGTCVVNIPVEAKRWSIVRNLIHNCGHASHGNKSDVTCSHCIDQRSVLADSVLYKLVSSYVKL